MFIDIIGQAIQLIVHLDNSLLEILMLTLKITLAALVVGGCLGILLGTIPAVCNFSGKKIFLTLLHALMGLPPVVVGLLLYLILSHGGALGFLNLLYTPFAMMMAQCILIIPIVASLTYNLMESMWVDYHEHWYTFQLSVSQKILQMIFEARFALIGVLLAGLGRSLSEVGAVLIVGGNIAHYTRVMTSTIVLETAKGNFVIALGVGILLMLISIGINVFMFKIKLKMKS